MLLGPYSPFRRWRNINLRAITLLVLTFLLIDSFSITSAPVSQVPLYTDPEHKDRIFIASIHKNSETLLRSHWNNAILDFITQYGRENVYVAILQNGNLDNTKAALRELNDELVKLGVEGSIELDDMSQMDFVNRTVAMDEEGWIFTSRGKMEPRRIPYLANLRNRVMAKLIQLEDRKENPRTFDKVLWVNDVVFTNRDIYTLLATRGGDYAVACGLDFARPPQFYDTFALRDIEGQKILSSAWPYFLSPISRDAVLANEPVPVVSCWNGIVAFDAAPFYHQPRLAFRGVSDSLARYHLEASECCLIHVDNYLVSEKGVWINTNVRVGYNIGAYKRVNPRDGSGWPSAYEKILGMWENRVMRLGGRMREWSESVVITQRITNWKTKKELNSKEVREERGAWCIINEMQVLVEEGWMHL